MRPAVFIDRDGTMIHDVGYLSRREDISWYAWTIDAIRLLNRAGFLVFVATNQGGIGLGFYTEDFLKSLHVELDAVLREAGAHVDDWLYCPHHPDARVPSLKVACECRKPGPGMVRQAEQRFEIDLARSFVIGDKWTDIGMATSVGARGILVRSGYGEIELRRRSASAPEAAYVAADLMEATSWLLRASGHPRGAA